MSTTFNATIGSDSAIDVGDIPASLRFRSGSSAYLSKTFSSAGNRKTWTFSCWFKRGALGSDQNLFHAFNAESYRGQLLINSNDTLTFQLGGSSDPKLVTTQVFRDPTAWVHLVAVCNTPAGVAGTDKMRLYLNGTEITSFSTDTNPTDDYQGNINQNYQHEISGYDGAGRYLDGYLARVCFVDGQALTPSDFITFNSNINEWVSKSASAVKAVVDAGGTNSFMLGMDDPNYATYNVGKDYSSKGNHWTPNGFNVSTNNTTYDWLSDVPGNSFAVLNPLENTGATLASGNLDVTYTSASWVSTKSSIPMESGEWYAEATANQTWNYGEFGVYQTSAALPSVGGTGYIGRYSNGYAYQTDGNLMNNNANITTTAISSGDKIMVAVDVDAGKVWFGRNGTWYNSGDPAAGTNASYTGLSGAQSFATSIYSATAGQGLSINFGQRPFAYTPPTGFKALNQANMSTPAVLDPTDGFQVVLATEDNIDANLATARSGWTDFVDIKKNRAASESWAWQFSHDSTKEYAVAASSLTYQNKRTNSGSNNWVGYSIRIGATYGTAAGSVSHTNGAATTVTHNVGKSARQMILLFNRAGGSAVPVYHPDCASGELLDLCTTAADAASTAITNVLTNSFQIGSGVATGTYDYLVIQEQAGFFDLGKYTGNGSSDGPYSDATGKPMLALFKKISDVRNWLIIDAARDPYNTIGNSVYLNTSTAEGTGNLVDLLSSGFKPRGSFSDVNDSAAVYATATFLSASNKYSLAR